MPLSVLFNETGLKKEGSWLISEGADGGKWSHSLPLAKALDDAMVVYGQNGEAVRPEQGYPVRLLVPGWEGPYSVKWLRQIKVVDEPYMPMHEAISHSIARPDLGNKVALAQFPDATEIVDYPPFGRTTASPAPDFTRFLAWRGPVRALSRRVEVSTDGGKVWKDAKLQGPVHRMAHTRFTFPWNWDGRETMIQARCTDEKGEIQPSLEELNKHWGITGKKTWQTMGHSFHFNAIQRWKVNGDGSVRDAMFV